MTKFRVLGGGWGEGYEVGDIFEAEFDSMSVRLAKGEVEEVKGKVKKAKKVKK